MSDVTEYLIDARTCVVSFASGGGEFGGDMPHFEFGNMLAHLGHAYVLLRDRTDYTYQYGVMGIGDREAVCNYLRSLATRYPRLVIIGLSVGALGALMYAQLADVGEVIALSPFTSLGDNVAHVFGPGFVPPDETPLHIDLLPLYEDGPRRPVRAFISDGEGTENDRWMAERVKIANITLVPGSSHAGLAKLMRDNGMLRELLDA